MLKRYETLDKRLEKNKYLGVEYSIADIATWLGLQDLKYMRLILENTKMFKLV